jgi:hypothetical protein
LAFAHHIWVPSLCQGWFCSNSGDDLEQ